MKTRNSTLLGLGAGRLWKAGWWSLEILMSITLCVSLMSAGVMTMYQITGLGGGLYPKNQMEQGELSKILLEIESDFYNAQRVYLWGSKIKESGAELSSNTHAVTVSSGDYTSLWNLKFPFDNSNAGAFLTNWEANNGNISSTADDTDHNYYTLIFFGGGRDINAVLYLTDTQLRDGSNNIMGVSYTLTRYENNGGRLVQTNTWTYLAPGATFASSDQGAALPSITVASGVYGGVTIRLPTAFSSALKEVGTGKTSRRVKNSADAWGAHGGYWTFAPDGEGRWLVQ